MRIQALKFKARPAKSEPERSFIDCRSSIDEIKASHPDSPAAFLIRDDDLPNIREHERLFMDRGKKNKHKGLSQSLLGKRDDRIPFINGNYGSVTQLARSIRDLLKNALNTGDGSLYVIAANRGIFNEVLRRISIPGKSVNWLKNKFDRDEEGINFRLLSYLKDRHEVPDSLENKFIGKSVESNLIRLFIAHASQVDQTVLITGDTGTGKEVIARSIHEYSRRNVRQLIPVNCGAIPHELLEAELFGHRRGAFSGAFFDKKGLWEQADKGTLFLDEIADLRPDHQVKVLRAIENGEIRRIGETKSIKVDARIIAATNRDLISSVQRGDFREDLYYRLNGIRIRTYPLRRHPEDIPMLANHFWKSITRDESNSLPDEVIKELMNYSWPGNARELKMHLANLYSLFGHNKIRADHVRVIFHIEGQTVESGSGLKTKDRKKVQIMESMRHLRKVYEIIHAIRTVISTSIMKPHIAKPMLESARTSVSLRLNELEILSHQPLLFQSEQTFFNFFHLIGKFMYFQDQLDHSIEEAKRYWDKEVKKELDSTLSTLQKELASISDR